MYSTRPGLILAFHGCDVSVVDKVITGKECLNFSENVYDWLGHGIYFWECSPSRALEFAENLKIKNKLIKKTTIENPSVIGAVLNLGYCLDLLDYQNLQLLKTGYKLLQASYSSTDFPINKKAGDLGDLLLRDLDCEVIESLHKVRREGSQIPFDSVRGVFWEGKELYPNAGFREKDHIQICVRNPNCIKGFFLPRELDSKFPKV